MNVLPSKEILRDKIHGCWIGKNIGGTLGGPLECDTSMHDISWFVKDPGGNPLPNDDLDLQLAWLLMAEFYGFEKITFRHFGEMWNHAIIGPWGEYANCRLNCQQGFFPPLSGSCDNYGLERSNGAWIRAEIWACLCAGKPDDAIRYAYMDSSCDHVSDGVYAEMFIAAMEAAAFCESDIRKIIEIGLCKIPDKCRLRESIDLAIKYYDTGKTWQEARTAVVELNADMGWFHAPANVAFAVIGLLYGEGDFGKSICTAVNCGDDTDCTAATVGALLGIIQGEKAIPEKWKAAIGDAIVQHSLNGFSVQARIPRTITELTDRVIRLREIGELNNPDFVVADEDFCSREAAEAIWKKSPYYQDYDLIFGKITVEYLDKPYLTPGVPNRLRIRINGSIAGITLFRFAWQLPEGYTSDTEKFVVGVRNYCQTEFDTSITPPENISDNMVFINLAVSSTEHGSPEMVTVPFRKAGSTHVPFFVMNRNTDSCRQMFAIDKRCSR
ncbi:MAG: ADP-ribosylglycohydrolase family protein [Lentisphaerae bacterium]|nr:ADP-ribosylglycohydrolase family protein [Lentisphaerota bacterium]